ncbi:MAG: type II toxin-antitoxin system YafQ family toxin [Firmicutes bacterium]|nr:type II toxin-antitoxin system YafQ family toxin [Candidatus Colivicinus equi]
MYKIVLSNAIKKDIKTAKKRGYNLNDFKGVVNKIANSDILPASYHDHNLLGKYKGFRECHIKPDWLLVYRIDNDELLLFLFRTGTHSDIFV